MIHHLRPKFAITFILLLLCSIGLSPLTACTGTHIGNASSFFDPSSDETIVEIEFCLSVTDLNGLPSDFNISFDGLSASPILESNANTLSASYTFNQDAFMSGFLCDCDNDVLGAPPTILTNTDTWTATAGAGNIAYSMSRSEASLVHECQIDCVNGEPTDVTGGAFNYMTDISTCYIISSKFSGDVEGQLASITLSGAENGLCDDNLAMSFNLSGSLPVELGSFDAVSNKNSVTINWTTFSETNVYKYIVERSADGFSRFEELGNTPVFVNSQAVKNYSFDDKAPLSRGFYRLKTVDIDGSFSYSHVILVEKEIADIRLVNVFPNPVETMTEIIFETKANSDVHFKVFDVNGSLQADQILEVVNGFNRVPFDFTGLREGIYFIVIESGTDKIVERITKF